MASPLAVVTVGGSELDSQPGGEPNRLECPSVCWTLLTSHSPWTPLQHLCPDFRCLCRLRALSTMCTHVWVFLKSQHWINSVPIHHRVCLPFIHPTLSVEGRGHRPHVASKERVWREERRCVCDVWHTCCAVLSGHLSCGSCILSAVCSLS